MIRLPCAHSGMVRFVAPQAVVSVTETQSASNWSLRSIVRLTNGEIIETTRDADDIARQIDSYAPGEW